MRIVIDLQAAQSPDSRHRGIGRYSIALAKAMLRNRGEHEVLIALNGVFADTIEPLREMFSEWLPAEAIRVWHATVPPIAVAAAAPAHRHAAELVREAFLASLNADVVHLSSMFEGGGYAVTSIHKSGSPHLTAVTLYDLIPHIYPEVYLPSPGAQGNYAEKLGHLCRADIWLAISESSRQEGIERLGLPHEQVVNISSAVDEHFTARPVAPGREDELRKRYRLPRPFVMYTGGIDHRKNIEGLIQAWAALPATLRTAHQLSIVCSVLPPDRSRLEQLALDRGLAPGDLVLTGFVPEEDLVDLYRLCKLFVFPSQHEGFGLPALEAMSCGAPVIGSNNSSIPEVIGRADALFDALSTESIAGKIQECLENEQLRTSLVDHGRSQARLFHWDSCARIALAAFERAVKQERTAAPPALARPKLAFVSPLPPERSGIAGYSAELLPALAAHYEIDLILDQATLDAPQLAGLCGQQTAEWFMEHGHEYDRVVYQFGNSTYHEYMFPLLERHPGTVVLHDFYLSGLMAHLELHGGGLQWSQALYESHGWGAVAERFHASPLSDAVYAFPANFPVLRQALGVIVHSEHALRLANEWYGPELTEEWALIPLLRTPAACDREGARQRLGLAADDFVVCSFGMLGPTKLNHRLLEAWRQCELSRAPGTRLLFVGEQQRGPYGSALEKELASGPGNVQVTGWVDNQAYQDYLDAADIAVQLRCLSRGETSAAVLDCMNHGLPTIANREGSMADLDPEAVCLVEQEFTDGELAAALDELWRRPERRAAMSQRSRHVVHTLHHPQACADAYAVAIEHYAKRAQAGVGPLVDEIGQVLAGRPVEPLLASLAQAIAVNMPERRAARQVLVDVTHQVRGLAGAAPLPPLLRHMLTDALTGWRAEPVYQSPTGEWRYARQYTLGQLDCPGHVLADDLIDLQPGDLWFALPGLEGGNPPTQPLQRLIEIGLTPAHLDHAQPVWSALAATTHPSRQRRWFVDISELVQRDWQSGIQRVVKNYLLELLLHSPADTRVVPVCATVEEPGYRVAQRYTLQLAGIEGGPAQGQRIDPREGDLFFGLDLQPHVVAAQADFLEGLREQGVQLAFMVYDLLPIRLPDCFSAGAAEHHARWLNVVAKADLAVCISQAVADDLALWLRQNPGARSDGAPLQIRAVHLGADLRHSLPSKGVPKAAERLLQQLRQRPSFLMVGTLEPRKDHAAVLAAFERLWANGQDVSLVISGRAGWMVESLVERLRSHPERNQRLFWIEDASDEYLERVYSSCACLIAASRGEGFGLPLVEAAQHGISIIARDLPVFREVAGEHAFYFADAAPEPLAADLKQWLGLYREGRHPSSKGMPWLTWHQSAERIKQILLGQAAQPATASG